MNPLFPPYQALKHPDHGIIRSSSITNLPYNHLKPNSIKQCFVVLLSACVLLIGSATHGYAQNVTQSGFTSVTTPQYMGSGDTTRLPVMLRATVTGLTANTTYRYFVQGATNSSANGASVDFGTTNPGAGNPLLINSSGTTYTYTTNPAISTSGNYETFTTDASGIYSGWFGFVNTSNTRFTAGNLVYPCIVIGSTSGSTLSRRALDVSITVLAYSGSAGSTNGSFLKGASSATAKNIAILYDNTAGTGRPLYAAPVESTATSISKIISGYSTSAGAWNAIIPNSNANGVRRIEQRGVTNNTLIGYNTDSDGSWPTGPVNTVNPTSGTTALSIASADAPLNSIPSSATITGTATATAFITTYGTASAAQTFTVSGSNLTADITATAPTGLQVSSDGTTYGATATFTQSGGTASGTLRIRLAATATVTGSYNGLTVPLTSTGATTKNITTAASGNIVSAKGLTITGVSATDKPYDRTNSATLSGTPTYVGLANSESFSVTGTPTATFSDAAAATGKSVTVTGYTAPSTNYTVTQPSLSADITPTALTITANNVTKVFGATLTGGPGSTAFFSLGLVSPETIGSVTMSYGSGAAAGDAVATYTGSVTPSAATGGTFSASNYSISYIAGDLTVTAAPTISLTGSLAAMDATYGTASATPTAFSVTGTALTGDLTVGAPAGFEVSSGGAYATSLNLTQSGGSVSATISVRLAATTAVGSYTGHVSVSGGSATTQTIAVPSSTVSPLGLTITGITGVNKPYDRNTSASVTGTPILNGVLAGDSGNVTVAGSPSATFATATAGTSRAITVTGYTLTGSAASNYTVTQPAGLTADITPLPLTVSGAAVTSKPFDGNADAVITGTLTGVIAPDVVTFSGTGIFASSAIGNGITVTSTSTIGGADAGNYSLTQPAGLTGNITAPALGSVNLANYVRVGRHNPPEPTRTAAPANNLLAQEASGVTYNWDTDSLFVVGDGGKAVVQVTKTGAFIDTMTLALGSSPQGTSFYDPEGITYMGGGQFVMTEERDRNLVKFTYAAGTTLSRTSPGVQIVKLGTFVDNIGLEGVSYDPQTGGFICFKEVSPQGIFQTGIDWNAGTATNGSAGTVNSVDLFSPGLLGLLDIADGFALSNLPALSGQPDSSRILVLSQESGKIVNTDRNGTVYSSLTIQSDPGNPLNVAGQQHEGMTMDHSGNLYVVSENGGGDIDHPQLWVYAPSTAPNAAPAAIALANTIPNIVENTSTIAPVRVADIVITDDGLGVNNLTVSGADAASFQITGDSLYIKAGVVLDYETKTSYSVTVNVDDTTLGGTPDAFVNFNLTVTDVVNEVPQAPAVFISEVNATGSSTTAYGADWFELTNNGGAALDITGWQMDDNSNGTAKVPLRTVTSIPAGKSAIFIEGAADGSTDATILSNFCNAWFGQSTPPAGVLIGFYGGSGVGLSSGGDAVNVFDAAGNRMAGVSFAASTTGFTFDNHAGLSSTTLPLPAISTLSAVGVNAAFSSTASPAEVGSPGITGKVILSEVAPWSSGNSPVAADWFELTNLTATTLNITGWQMDDNSNGSANVPLTGITAIAPGESVIFIETATLSTTAATFRSNWFGANPPAGLQIGAYSGGGVGLGTSGDAVNIFDASGTTRVTGVAFGSSTTGFTFDNAAGLGGATLPLPTISTLSVNGVNGAFTAVNSSTEHGSPGAIANAPILVTIAATDASAAETASDAGTFRIARTGSTAAALNVSYTIATGVGQAATSDYGPALSGIAAIPIGASFVDIAITPVDDTIVESDETVALTIVDTAAYDLGATFTASLTIADNDAALASFTVAAGDVTSGSAVVWAKLGVLGAVNVELFSDEGLTQLVNSASGTVTDVGIPLKWSFAGLTAQTSYFYSVTDSASTAKTGKFKTAFAPTTIGALHFGVSGDQRGELAPYPSVKNAAARNLDFFLQFGDNVYADVSSVNVPIAQCRSLSEYRAKNNEVYSTRYGMNTLADLRASTAVLAVIDDHEVTNDFSGGALRTSDSRFSSDTGTYINETETFANGVQAFLEYHPINNLSTGATGDPITANHTKLYRYSTQGRTAAMYVLDTRSFRSAPLTPVANITDPAQVGAFIAASFTPGRTLLGNAQKAQFKADLLAAQAAGIIWKFVCSPEPVQNFGPLGAEDRYEGYAAERTELLKFIDDNHISNVVFVTADFHGTVVNRLSYQTAPFGPQIQTNSIEVITGAIAYDKPFGPTIVDLAIAAGLAAPGTDLYYQSLSAPDKEALVVNNIINPNLANLGYNPIGLTANPLPMCHLIGGLYTATNSYGWTEFTIDAVTRELNVKTWGIAPYNKAQLDADPATVIARTPAVVSEFALALKPYFNQAATAGLTAEYHGATIELVGASGALPAGGSFSGPGVTGSVFDPAAVAAGVHTLAYAYQDSFGTTQSSTFTITVLPSPLDAWRLANFETTSNTGDTADTADFDHDGIPNLMEYALGLNPKVAAGPDGPAALPASVTNDADPLLAGRLALSLTLPDSNPTDISYVIQATGDLGDWTDVASKTGNGAWTWLAEGTSRIVISGANPAAVKIGDSVPADATHPQRMMRLKVVSQ